MPSDPSPEPAVPPRFDATPLPFGANTPPVIDDRSPYISRAESAGRNADIDDVVEAIIEHHPAAPSARATASIARTSVTGSTSGPP